MKKWLYIYYVFKMNSLSALLFLALFISFGLMAVNLQFSALTTANCSLLGLLGCSTVVSALHCTGYLCSQRLNFYFVIQNVWMSRYKNILQVVDAKHIKSMPCKQITYDMVASSKDLLRQLNTGYYRIITHATILSKLEETNVNIVKKISLGEKDMGLVWQSIRGFSCLGTCRKKCVKRRMKRLFYYLEFQVTEHIQGCNCPLSLSD